MSRPERGEDEVRRLLQAGPRPRLPAGLPRRALARGARARRRARALRRALWALLTALALAFTCWAVVAEPWRPPPSDTAPPFEGW
ncbi:hypothetical protein ACLGI4_10335 [Streptomyces sp. HMX112]|uniref:hypothetical protein n=1 Tax=Streptomyces sp. HMX112 TaxID=3390850 RepID=UPI003A80C58B